MFARQVHQFQTGKEYTGTKEREKERKKGQEIVDRNIIFENDRER